MKLWKRFAALWNASPAIFWSSNPELIPIPAARQIFEPRKLAGAIAVLALHLAVIAAFVSVTRIILQPRDNSPEIVLHFLEPQTITKPTEKKSLKEKTTVPRELPIFAAPNFVVPKSLQAPPTGSAGRQSFFDCDPAQLATATPEQRAACVSASLAPRYDSHATDYRDHTDRSKNAAQWARDRDRKNGPLLLPCMDPAGWSPLYTAYCLGKAVVTGKLDAENQAGYEDMPQHVSNDGDTRMAPVPH